MEVLVNTSYIADMIAKLEVGGMKDAIERGGNYKMQSFDQHLVWLYHEGKISEDVACEYADSASNVKIQIRTADAGKKVGKLSDGSLSLTPRTAEEEDEQAGMM